MAGLPQHVNVQALQYVTSLTTGSVQLSVSVAAAQKSPVDSFYAPAGYVARIKALALWSTKRLDATGTRTVTIRYIDDSNEIILLSAAAPIGVDIELNAFEFTDVEGLNVRPLYLSDFYTGLYHAIITDTHGICLELNNETDKGLNAFCKMIVEYERVRADG